MKPIETRLTEVRYTTSDPQRMINRFISKRVLRTWTESFIDEDSGKTVDIERNEVLFEKGTYVDADILTQISFWIAEGAITEIEVSNQKRMSFEFKNNTLFPYKCSIKIDDRKRTYLLYATSVQNALLILTDYVELNSNGGFDITEIKGLDGFVVIIDKFLKQANTEATTDNLEISEDNTVDDYLDSVMLEMEESEEDSDKTKLKFYQILSRVVLTDKSGTETESTHTFVVNTYNCTRANLLIEKWLRDKQEENYRKSLENPDFIFEKKDIHSFVEESKIVPFGCFIPTEFSMAYQEETSA